MTGASEPRKLVFRRLALLRIMGERRAPDDDADAAQIGENLIKVRIERRKAGGMRQGGDIPFARAEAGRLEIRPESSGRREEDIVHMGVAVNWNIRDVQAGQRGACPFVRIPEEGPIV